MLEFIKPIIFALVMFFSLRLIGLDADKALLVSLIPLILGYLNILNIFVYSWTAIIFIVSIIVTVFPEFKSVLSNVLNVFASLFSQVKR